MNLCICIYTYVYIYFKKQIFLYNTAPKPDGFKQHPILFVNHLGGEYLGDNAGFICLGSFLRWWSSGSLFGTR